MSDMIDKVAKAMLVRAAERGHHVNPLVANHIAVAAIEAMREPTLQMVALGVEELGQNKPDGHNDGMIPRDVWHAMIDAALAQH